MSPASQPQAHPSFAAVLPFSQRADPVGLLEAAAADIDESDLELYRFSEIAGRGRFAAFRLAFGGDYQVSQAASMERRYDSAESGLTPARAAELFTATYEASLTDEGLLKVDVRALPGWTEDEVRVGQEVLAFHFYHLAKFLAEVFRKHGGVVPGIGVRKWMTSLSPHPEEDLLAFMEQSARSTHERVIEQSALHFSQLHSMCNTRRGRLKFAVEAVRHGVPWKLVHHARRQCYRQRTTLFWNYDILRRALPGHDPESRVKPQIDRVCHDFAEIESHSDFLAGQLSNLGASFGIAFAALGVVAGLLVTTTPNPATGWVLLAMAGGVTAYGFHGMNRILTSIRDEAAAVLAVFNKLEHENVASQVTRAARPPTTEPPVAGMRIINRPKYR